MAKFVAKEGNNAVLGTVPVVGGNHISIAQCP